MQGYIRKRGKDSWEVTVGLGRDPSTGRRRRFLLVRGTKRDAERALAEAVHQRDTGIDVSPGKLTVGEYLRRWLRDYATHNVAPSTLARYRSIIEHHLIPALGGLKLTELRPAHIQAAYAVSLQPGGRRDGSPGGLSAQTVLHHHRLLREAFHHAVRWQLAARNPTDAVAPPRPAITEMRVLDADQVAELLTAAAETPYYAFIYVAVATGARLGELLALRWEDIDLGTGTMFITRTVKRIPGRGLTFSTPKTHRSRRPVALSAETRNVFQEHRRRQLEHRLKMGPAYQDQGLVFASSTGQLMDDSNLRRAFARIVSAARLEHLRIHDLRHTAATLMLRAGVHPKVVSERLGHATVSITLDTYSHVLPDMQRDAAEALDRLMGPSSTWASKEQ